MIKNNRICLYGITVDVNRYRKKKKYRLDIWLKNVPKKVSFSITVFDIYLRNLRPLVLLYRAIARSYI